MHLSTVCLATLAASASSVHAQQFPAAKQSYEAMGLSDECTKVLNTELEHCDSLLFERTDRTIDNIVDVLPREELDLICEPKCREDLSALREKIIETCTASEDVMRNSGFEFPAFYFADKFAYTFDINCYKHKSSGRFCDEVYSEWRDGKVEYDQCDDCYLGQLAAQISSPIGVSDERVALFKEVQAACQNAEYEVKVAKSYAQFKNTTEVASVGGPEDTRNCARWYTLKNRDTCTSISLSQNSSTVNLIQNNAMDINCNSLPDVGTKLCLDEPCDTHTIRSGEDCAAISKKYGISKKQFRSLNTMIDADCSNIARWEGYVVCVGPTSLITEPAQGRLPSFTSEQAYLPIPMTPKKPLAPGSSTKCDMFVNGRALTDPDFVARWKGFDHMMNKETLQRHNRCGHVSDINRISIQDFKRMNPSLDKPAGTKCFLEEKYSYCLAEKGGPRPQIEAGWDRQFSLRWG
ncbi:hypothetical protein ACHAQA_006692 [Verticillium albo-atrum]